MPERIQLRRAKGWKMPPNTVSVARPGAWGNHARIGYNDPGFGFVRTNGDAVVAYRMFLERNPIAVEEARRELRGKNLACWCKPGEPCHADVLLELANT